MKRAATFTALRAPVAVGLAYASFAFAVLAWFEGVTIYAAWRNALERDR